MKKFTVLMLAAIFMMASAVVACAAKLEVKGSWRVVSEYLDNKIDKDNGGVIAKKADQHNIKSRARAAFHFVASENLKAVTELQFFNGNWGQEATTTNPTDNTPGKKTKVEATKAYIDFNLPQSGIKVQTGFVPFAVPSATEVFTPYDETAGGFVVAAPLNDMMSLDLAWMRLLQNKAATTGSNDKDLFFAGLKVATDAYEITPWLLFANYQENVKVGTIENQMIVALSGKVNMDALTVATDIYFGKNKGKDAEDGSNFGGIVSASMAMDMMTPEVYVGYFGGNKQGKNNTMPLIAADVTKTTLLFDDSALGAGNILDDNYGANGSAALASSLFFGVGLNDMSFIENLSHSANILYLKGNTEKAVTGWNEDCSAYTVDFNTKYQIYEQLALIAEIGLAHVEADKKKNDLFGTTVGLKYSF